MLRRWNRKFNRKGILPLALFGVGAAVQLRFVKSDPGGGGVYGGYDGGVYGGYSGYHSRSVSPVRSRRRRHYAVWEDDFSRRPTSRHIPLLGSISYEQPVAFARVAAAAPDAMPTPIAVDLNVFIRRSGIDTDYDVNVISVEEKGVSVLSTDWSAENAFVEFDDMGNIKYHPRGTYLWNILEIDMELSNEMYPPSLEGILGGAVYRMEEVPTDIVESADENTERAKRKFTLVVDEDYIGDEDAGERFTSYQGNDGTCVLHSAANALAQLGATDEEGQPITADQVIEDMTARYGVRPDGTVFLIRPARLTTAQGRPYYAQMVEVDENNQITNERPIYPSGYNTRHLEELPEEAKNRLPSNRRILSTIAEEYDVTVEADYATTPIDIIIELTAGRPLAITVDSTEIQPSYEDYLEEIDERDPAYNARANHMITVTGLDLTKYRETGNINDIIVEITDSSFGQEQRRPLDQFLDSWGDSGFAYWRFDDGSVSEDVKDDRDTREAHKQHKKDGYNINRRIHYALRDPRAETATDHLASNTRLKEIIDALPDLNQSEKDGFNINTLAKVSQQDREEIFQELDKVTPIHGGYKALYEKWVSENVDFLDALNIELPPDFEAKWRDLAGEFEDAG